MDNNTPQTLVPPYSLLRIDNFLKGLFRIRVPSRKYPWTVIRYGVSSGLLRLDNSAVLKYPGYSVVLLR